MTGWVTVISLAIGFTLYRTLYGEPGIVDSALVGGLSASIGGGLSSIYKNYFSKHNNNVINWIDNILWFVLFCLPGALIGYIISSFLGESSVITILVMLVFSILFTARKIKNKEKILKRDFFEDLR